MDTRFKTVRAEFDDKIFWDEWKNDPQSEYYQYKGKFSTRLLAKEFAKREKPYYCETLKEQRIRKLEIGACIASPEELKAYCLFFNTTSDYLLGIRDTQPVNENLAMISRVTGLTGDSISYLKDESSEEEITVLNAIIETGSLNKLACEVENYFDTLGNNLYVRNHDMNATDKDIYKPVSDGMQKMFFDYFRSESLRNIFNLITHNRNLYNYFMRKIQTQFLEHLKEVPGITSEMIARYDKEIAVIKKTDYYDKLSKRK